MRAGPDADVLVEICAASLEDALQAQAGGAHRLELSSALELGGLTPSLGSLIEIRQAVRLPIIALLRPRSGGFAYGASDFKVMQRDLDLLLEHGAHGIALGIITEDGGLDRERCQRLVAQAQGRELVFHRAFDVTPDPFQTLEELIDLGFRRVLTSGHEKSALRGASLIRALLERAAGRIEILPAGGINRLTVAAVLAQTGCRQIHASLRTQRIDNSTARRPQIAFRSPINQSEIGYDATDEAAVAEMVRIVGNAAS
jgi:copper homeostasis protein